MTAKAMTCIYGTLIVMAIGVSSGWAAKSKKSKRVALVPVQKMELNATGKKLAARYEDQLKALQTEIEKALPKVDERQKSAFLKAYQNESAAITAELLRMKNRASAKDKQAAAKAYDAAKETLEKATADAQALVNAIMPGMEKFLASDQLDAQLMKCAVLTKATPHGLAAFAQQGSEQEALVEKLLADRDLMKQILIADGALGGRYGEAMKIYSDVQKASPKAKDGCLQRLALAIGLEHAVPVVQTNPKAQTDAPSTVDPVKRYLHYEKAFLDGELDPGFKDLTVWELRNAVNGDEPDEILAWGREMLRTYRPDLVSLRDYRWRYVKSVTTEVKYGSQDVPNDRPELQKYQNIIMNGGVCGRRAFFGRFILRSFGIPTLARPQHGHAALVHWTPKGWVINLGAGWRWGTINNDADIDFLAITQARKVEADYPQVLRAQWVATALGEKKAPGFTAPASGFWSGVALYRQREIAVNSKTETLAAVGTELGESDKSNDEEVVETATLTAADKKIAVDKDGVITIPAAACSNSSKVRFMPSNLGGTQLHSPRGGGSKFEYPFDAPAAGTYALSARVATTSDKQILMVVTNAAKEVQMDIPLTTGLWGPSQPLEIQLVKGRNVLRFSRWGEIKGLTIKDFTLKPVKKNPA